ncbi:FAD-dependent oxidoreductase [Sphaerimonospora thailandensis]|uniref:FAD-binding dehydrogenase n=1 Tax=Sphaerimonospora thailandensis TaxID=795644 RepID=A0A8J3RC82_9ACTN|nr:FAD-dependent oxidoreductase [Sphaerimonospora thailandensis]GIH71154.1 FAD-binding dehydrogenase [Sphaerimonospora thailandensis]
MEPSQQRYDRQADVVVLGGGAAGCAAAIAAHDAGAEVLILEKCPPETAGGNTRVSGGSWFENLDADRAAVYLRNLCGDFPVPEEVIRVWAEETRLNSKWMESLGGNVVANGVYTPEYPHLDGADCYGGYRSIEGRMGDQVLYQFLTDAVRARGIEIRYATPGRELITDGGAVVGVVAEQDGGRLRVRARRGVVLATGGFENDPAMVRDYLRLPPCPVWGSPAGTGDGHRMAQKAGADLWHMDNMAAFTGIRVPGSHSGFFIRPPATGFIWVADDGRRFVDEAPALGGHGQARVHGRDELHPVRAAYVVFDERTRRAGPLCPPRMYLPVGWQLLMEGYDWSPDNQAEIDRGWIRRADTVAELAVGLGLDPETLTETVSRWNAACAAGRDDHFGRRPESLTPLDEGPFYAFESAPLLGWTSGGPRRDEHCRVLDPFGSVIPGLYAAGSVSSTYSWAKDGGFHIADALAFGRVAGRHAAD